MVADDGFHGMLITMLSVEFPDAAPEVLARVAAEMEPVIRAELDEHFGFAGLPPDAARRILTRAAEHFRSGGPGLDVEDDVDGF